MKEKSNKEKGKKGKTSDDVFDRGRTFFLFFFFFND